MNSTNPVIYPDGTQAWFVNGEYRRTDGPAVIYADGSQFWYLNDQLHRTDGPAVIYADGSQRWYINHKRYTSPKEFQLVGRLSDTDMLVLLLKYEFN